MISSSFGVGLQKNECSCRSELNGDISTPDL